MGESPARRNVLGILAVVALLAAVGARPSFASFHLIKVVEVFQGFHGSDAVQYVELQMYAAGQNQLSGHSLHFYNEFGDEFESRALTNVANGANQASVLIGTTSIPAKFGITPDFTIAPIISPFHGKVCFDTIDCVSWGDYSGPSQGTGAPFQEGVPDNAAIGRDITRGNPTALDAEDDTEDSAADFDVTAPTPRNNASATGSWVGGTIGFSELTYPTSELAGEVTIAVTRSRTTETDSVRYSTSPGSASDTDYAPATGILSFAVGQASSTFDIAIPDDGLVEGDESFTVQIRDPQKAVLQRPEAVVTIVGEPRVPGAPVSLTATPSADRVAVGWQPPVDDGGQPISEYRIYAGSDAASLILIGTAASSARSFTESGLAPGQVRAYAVSAVNVVGEGPTAAPVTVVMPHTPSAPRNVRALAGPGAGEISLSWTVPSSQGGAPIASYNVYNTSSSPRILLGSVSADQSTFRQSGLPPGATRAYAVAAANSYGEGELSPSAVATTFTAPGAPSGVNPSPGSSIGELRVSWSPPSTTGGTPVTGYKVYRTAQNGSEQLIATVDASTRTYTDEGAVGTRYTYRVGATNIVGEGPRSAAACTRPYPWVAALRCTI